MLDGPSTCGTTTNSKKTVHFTVVLIKMPQSRNPNHVLSTTISLETGSTTHSANSPQRPDLHCTIYEVLQSSSGHTLSSTSQPPTTILYIRIYEDIGQVAIAGNTGCGGIYCSSSTSTVLRYTTRDSWGQDHASTKTSRRFFYKHPALHSL